MNLLDVPLTPAAAAVAAALIGSVFAAADMALATLSRARLGALLEQSTGATRASLTRIAREELALRARYLLGRMLAVALAAALLLETLRASFPGWAGVGIAVVATVAVMAPLYAAATTLGRVHADQAAPGLARWLRPLELLLLPLALPIGWLGKALQKSRNEEVDPRVAEAEVEHMVDEVERQGLVGAEPAEMIRNVLEFADRTALDVMIPRGNLEAIEIDTPLAHVVAKVTEGGHSRYPVYREQIDNIVGLLYAKDLFRGVRQSDGAPIRLEELVRSPANFVAGSQPLAALLREMRSRRQHLAVVVDELGAVAGIVTLEDILEEIVGDIRDEHDEQDPPITELEPGRYLADGSVRVRELGQYLGLQLPDVGDETVGVLLAETLGRVPEAGTRLEKLGLGFRVRQADRERVLSVEIARAPNRA